jgi:hypothetical protein
MPTGQGSTLFLLRYLARKARASHLRILLVFSYQEIELDSNLPLHNVLADIHRDHLVARIKLTRFDREGTHLMLENLLKDKVSPDLVDSIYRETEGTSRPFYDRFGESLPVSNHQPCTARIRSYG